MLLKMLGSETRCSGLCEGCHGQTLIWDSFSVCEYAELVGVSASWPALCIIRRRACATIVVPTLHRENCLERYLLRLATIGRYLAGAGAAAGEPGPVVVGRRFQP